MTRGVFITFEGCDGSGKSTQIALLESALTSAGHKVLVLREPGGSRVGEKIREVLLDADNREITPTAELLLYEAARAQMVEEIVEPALEQGIIVLCDRFYDSTTAYQGFGRGIDLAVIEKLNTIAAAHAVPDKTIFLDLDPAHSLDRATRKACDRLESEGHQFQEKVREGFLYAANKHSSRIAVVDGSRSREEIAARVREALEPLGLFSHTNESDG